MREKKIAERYTQVDKRVCVKREDFISQSRCVVGTWHITQSFLPIHLPCLCHKKSQ